MGNRTVVVLYNDQTREWESDPELGRKIMIGMNHVNDKGYESRADLHYGRVVECAHADTHTLGVFEGYQFRPIMYDSWYAVGREKGESPELRLVRKAADALGYTLHKKPEKASK